MPLSLNNSKDIVANSISIIKGNKTVDLLSSFDAVTGDKADKSTTYTKSNVDDHLDTKVDDIEMTNYATKTHVDDKIAALVGTAPNILHTLQEIASSINNDNIFSTTMVNA